MATITAVIFDLYETLVHNERSLWLSTFDEICREQGLPLDGRQLWDRWMPLDLEFRRDRYAPSYPFKTYEEAWGESFRLVFQGIGKGDPGASARRMVHKLGRRVPFPETLDVVARLRASGRFRLGVLSNADNDYLEPLLDGLGLAFDGVLSSESARAYKPKPAVFRQILAGLEVEPEESLYVGDSQHDDVQGAKQVGMLVTWVNRNGAHLDPSLPTPDYVISNLLELLDILEVPKGGEGQ